VSLLRPKFAIARNAEHIAALGQAEAG